MFVTRIEAHIWYHYERNLSSLAESSQRQRLLILAWVQGSMKAFFLDRDTDIASS